MTTLIPKFKQTGTGASNRAINLKLAETISVNDFGAVGDGVTDDTTAIQNALNAATGLSLLIPNGTYKITSQLTVYGNVIGDNATLMFSGAVIGTLVSQSVQGNLTGLIIDGTNVPSCQYGLFVDTDFVQTTTCYYDLTIQNISNSNNTQSCNGAVFFKSSSASVNLDSNLDIKINVSNITATANGSIGDTAGSSTGILVSFNGTGTNSQVIIRDSVIANILPVEDSAGIQIVTGDSTSTTAKGFYLIENCYVTVAKKRGFKIQAQNTTVQNCTVDASDTTIAFDTYGINTLFSNCRAFDGSGIGFNSAAANTRISQCNIQLNSQFSAVYLATNAVGTVIEGSTFSNAATYATVANALVTIVNNGTFTFSNCIFTGSAASGSCFNISNTGTLTLDLCTISGVSYGFNLSFNVGSVYVINSTVTCDVAAYRTGNTALTMYAQNSTFTTTSIGLYLNRGASHLAIANVDNCVINSAASGIIARDGSTVNNCMLTNATTTGSAIACGNSKATNNVITNYATGIDYTFTTTAVVMGNVTIGTTTPYNTTGFTAFANVNNFSR